MKIFQIPLNNGQSRWNKILGVEKNKTTRARERIQKTPQRKQTQRHTAQKNVNKTKHMYLETRYWCFVMLCGECGVPRWNSAEPSSCVMSESWEREFFRFPKRLSACLHRFENLNIVAASRSPFVPSWFARFRVCIKLIKKLSKFMIYIRADIPAECDTN